MRKALHYADVSVQDMADYLDVARNTTRYVQVTHDHEAMSRLRLDRTEGDSWAQAA